MIQSAYSKIFSAIAGSTGSGGGGSAGAGPITGYAGLCVDVRSASSANFTPVQVYTCNGTNAQQWTVAAGNTRSGRAAATPTRTGLSRDSNGGGPAEDNAGCACAAQARLADQMETCS